MKDPNQPERIDLLSKKWQEGTISEEEKREFEAWYANFDEHVEVEASESREQAEARYYQQIAAKAGISKRSAALWPRIAAVAAAIAFLVIGAYFFKTTPAPGSADLITSAFGDDVAPGKNTATLTLANGKVIQLSEAKTGVVIDASSLKYSDGSAIHHVDLNDRDADIGGRHPDAGQDPGPAKQNRIPFWSGALKQVQGDVGASSNAFNRAVLGGKMQLLTASTPLGGTYQFILPDGSKVWLNSGSKLKFPSSFKGSKQRLVQLSGEGYFEVAKDKAHPFIVSTDKQKVEVLGTHFNINSYSDESSVKTTLLEGSVRVRHAEFSSASRTGKGEMHGVNSKAGALTSSSAGSYETKNNKNNLVKQVQGDERPNDVVLKPNQQALLNDQKQIVVKQVDASEAIAWKNGDFVFNDESIADVLRKVSRWYDVEIIYVNGIPPGTYYAKVSRNKNISQVLRALELTKLVHFKVEGRRILVTK